MHGYSKTLANEWISWVESSNGTREQEIFPLIKDWLKEVKPKVLADIGCGQGSCSALVEVKYIGIDPSLTLLERAKSLFPSKTFIEGDAYNIPLESSSSDAVLSVWVWSHLSDLKAAAKEMFRILKPKGHFLVITANPETYEERKTFYKHYTIKGNLLTGTFNLGNGKTLTNTTLYLHSEEEIEEALRQAGFKIDSVKRLGKSGLSDKGLYLAMEGSK